MKKKLLDYLYSSNLFFKNLFGFKPGKDTNQPVTNVIKCIYYTALKNKKVCYNLSKPN